MKKTIIFSLLTGVLLMQTLVFAATFRDITSTHWAYQYIIELTKNNVINGYTDGTFKPENTITRAEFIKLVVMSALPEWMDIEDAESNLNHWASKYLWVAERYGLIATGSLSVANLDEPITRIEMVRIISKADLALKGNDLETKEKVKFKDVISLNNDDLLLLKHSCSKGLITGYADNTFKPYNNMTRAEAATMIYRFK